MRKNFIIIFLLFLGTIGGLKSQTVKEQVSPVDSASLFVLSYFEFSYNFPLADLKTDYKNFMAIGTGISVKTKGNWIYNFGFNYQFGGKVRDAVLEESFKNIIPEGANYFIANDGTSTNEVSVDYRGLYFNLVVGKVIPVTKRYKNSGILLKAGIGVTQHYMHITNPDNKVLALTPEYRKGYDRLTLGFSLYEFLGYQHLTKRNLLCFYGGVEFQQNFSKRQREYDFVLMGKDNNKYFEALIGLKFGWIIPLYKHNPYRVFQYTR